MKALLLAAGTGSRLKPLTENLPKVMVPVFGKPILEYHVEQLAEADIRELFINLHCFPDKIRDYFKDGKKWGLNIQYSFESEPLGTSGAVKNLEKELGTEPFLVVYGDNFHKANYTDFIKFSTRKDGVGNIAVFEKENVKESGIVAFNKSLQITRFKEKPRQNEIFSHWVNAGFYYFRSKVFDYIKPGFSDFGKDILPEIIKKNEILYAYKIKTKVWGIDSIELLNELKNSIIN